MVERAYRNLDACELYHVGIENRARGTPAAAVSQQLEEMTRGATRPAPLVPDWPDRFLRLRPGRELTEDCLRELDRDRRGFTLYGNLAWRNAIGLNAGVVFARDLYSRNEILLARYPGWEVWRWAPPDGAPAGDPVLSRLRPALSDNER